MAMSSFGCERLTTACCSEGVTSPMLSYNTDAQINILGLIGERLCEAFSELGASNRLTHDMSENVMTFFYEFGNVRLLLVCRR